MGTPARIPRLLSIVLLFWAAGDASAGEKKSELAYLSMVDEEEELLDEFAFLAEEDIVYTAAKHEQDIGESPSAITVITREQIENTWCTDVVCLLRGVPEMMVMRIRPMYASVGARALTDEAGEKVLLLIDGMEINNEIFGTVLWQALPVHLEDIERIEVIRGPGSALYGANAHSAVVSIFTRRKTENTAEVFSGCGEHGRTSLHARAGHQSGKWKFLLSGGADYAYRWRNDEWIRKLGPPVVDPLERDTARVVVRTEYETPSSRTSAQAGLVTADGPVHSIIGSVGVKDAVFAHFIATHSSDWLKSQLSFNALNLTLANDTRDEMTEYAPIKYAGTKLGEARTDMPIFGATVDAEVQLNWSAFEGNMIVIGSNYRWTGVFSDVLQPEDNYQHRVGAYLHYEQRLGERLILTSGIRFDINSITPFTVSPRLAGVWQFAPGQHLRLAFGQAFRKPSFMNAQAHIKDVRAEPAFPEVKDFMLRAIGNAELENESMTSLEAGYHGRFFQELLSVEAVAFYNRYRDTITFHSDFQTRMGVPDLTASSAQFRNTGRDVDSVGGAVSATFTPFKQMRISANYSYRYTFFVSDPSGIAAEKEGKKGDRFPGEPIHLVNLNVQYLPRQGLRLGVGVHAASSWESAAFAGDLFDPRQLMEVSERIFTSAFAAWKLDFEGRWVEIGVRAYNLFHEPFSDYPVVIDANTTFLGGELLGRRIFLFARGSF
jgi:outer membrane receptor for ferrienterochelin and colicin